MQIKGINDPESKKRREARREEKRIAAEEARLRAAEQAKIRKEKADAEAAARKVEDTKKALEQGFSGYEEYMRYLAQVARDKKILNTVKDIDQRLRRIEIDNIHKLPE